MGGHYIESHRNLIVTQSSFFPQELNGVIKTAFIPVMWCNIFLASLWFPISQTAAFYGCNLEVNVFPRVIRSWSGLDGSLSSLGPEQTSLSQCSLSVCSADQGHREHSHTRRHARLEWRPQVSHQSRAAQSWMRKHTRFQGNLSMLSGGNNP